MPEYHDIHHLDAPAHGRRAPLQLCATAGLVRRGHAATAAAVNPAAAAQAGPRLLRLRRSASTACIGSVAALHSRRLRITREHAGDPGELARGLRLRSNEPCERLAGIVIGLSVAPVGATRVTGS